MSLKRCFVSVVYLLTMCLIVMGCGEHEGIKSDDANPPLTGKPIDEWLGTWEIERADDHAFGMTTEGSVYNEKTRTLTPGREKLPGTDLIIFRADGTWERNKGSLFIAEGVYQVFDTTFMVLRTRFLRYAGGNAYEGDQRPYSDEHTVPTGVRLPKIEGAVAEGTWSRHPNVLRLITKVPSGINEGVFLKR